MSVIIETFSGIKVHKSEDGSYSVYRDGWKHTDCSAEDVMRALGFYLDDRYKRAKKFERARERVRCLRTYKWIKLREDKSYTKANYGIWTQDGFGSVRELTFSEIRRLLTEETIPDLK